MAERPPVGARRIRKPEIRRRWLLLWGFVVISGSFLASVALHSRDLSDADDLFHDPHRPGEAQAVSVWSGPLLLLRSDWTDRRVFDESGGDYGHLIRSTGSALERLGIASRETHSLSPGGDVVLFLEHPLCLAVSDWDSLRAWVEDGGALVVSGPLGVRDGNGEWAGWDRMRSLLQVDRFEERMDARPAFVTLADHAPLADPDLQGYRLALRQGSHILGFFDAEPLAYWSGFHREPIPETGRPMAAAAARTFGAGRIIWLGFPLGWLHEDPDNDRAASAWLQGLLEWCTGRATLAALEPWPHRAEAAVLLAQDAEEDFGQAAAFAGLLDQHGLRGTFLCVSDEAEGQMELVRSIAARHEIGSHTDDHRPVAGGSYRDQKRRLERSARSLERMSGRRVKGFRPPEEHFDANTLRAMTAAGYEYLLGHSSEPRAVPVIMHVPRRRGEEPGRLVQIPRLVRDDYNYLVLSPTPLDEIPLELSADLETVRRYRGVNYVSIHTHLLGHADRIDSLGPFLKSLHGQPVWVATGSEVAEWILARSDLKVEIDLDAVEPGAGPSAEALGTGPGGMRTIVRVSNPGRESVAGLVLVVCGLHGMAAVSGPPPGGPADSAGRVRYPLPEIRSGGECVLVFARAVSS